MNKDENQTVRYARFAEQNGTHYSASDLEKLGAVIKSLQTTYLKLTERQQ